MSLVFKADKLMSVLKTAVDAVSGAGTTASTISSISRTRMTDSGWGSSLRSEESAIPSGKEGQILVIHDEGESKLK